MFRFCGAFLLVGLAIGLANGLTACAFQSASSDSISKEVDAGPVHLKVSVSQTVAAVAEPVTIDWLITAPAGTKVWLPEVSQSWGEFEIVNHTDWLDVPDATGRQWRRTLTIETIQTGELILPALEIGLAGVDTPPTIQTPEIPLRITSLLEGRPDPAAFRDIRSVMDLPVPKADSWAWVSWSAGGLVALAAVVALAIVATRRRRWLTPLAWVDAELDSLSAELSRDPAESGFAGKLSALTRGFIEMQFGIEAIAGTSQQIVGDLRSRAVVDSAMLARLDDHLQQLDMAMYARMEIEPEVLKQSIADFRELAAKMATGPVVADSARAR